MSEDREVPKAVFQSTPDCPTLDELLNADAPAKGEMDCPHCAGEVALYGQFIAEVPAGVLDEKILRRLNDRLLTKEVELRGTMHLAGRPMRRRVRGVMLRNDLANRAVHRRPPCRVL